MTVVLQNSLVSSPIPIASADVSGNEERYVVEAIRSSWISSSGAFVDRFEREFATRCGAREAIAVCNGTAALHLALAALDVGPGDEVIVPGLTYIATANAARYVSAEPVFADVDRATWCIDPRTLEASVTPRTRGIIAVHAYGQPADMKGLRAFADARGLWVIEDAAQAHFAQSEGRTVGTLGRLATFSFFGNKIFTCGEGGAITLDDSTLAARLRLLRNQGMDPAQRYFHPVTGFNFRLTNVACAMLCAQLERADTIIDRRRAIFARYEAGLSGIPGIGLQPRVPSTIAAPWLFSITVDPEGCGMTRDEVAKALTIVGIETRPFFQALHRMPPFEAQSRARHEHLPITDALAANGMNLPTFNTLDDASIDRVCRAIRDIVGASKPAPQSVYQPATV